LQAHIKRANIRPTVDKILQEYWEQRINFMNSELLNNKLL